MKERCVFLDRDGVVNAAPGVEQYYVHKWSEFQFLPGAPEAIAKLSQSGWRVVIVSNQSGVARKAMSEADLDDITRRMLEGLQKKNARVDGVFYCRHDDADACACRKPKPGLFHEAARQLGVDFAKSYNVGDSERDIAAGNAAGVPGILVLCGKSKASDAARFAAKPVYVSADLSEAVEWILNQKKS